MWTSAPMAMEGAIKSATTSQGHSPAPVTMDIIYRETVATIVWLICHMCQVGCANYNDSIEQIKCHMDGPGP